MKLNIFSVFDIKANAHLPPFFLPNNEMAIRVFSDCCNDQKHAWGAHPDHYTLFEHGNFDQDTGVFEIRDGMYSLGNGAIFLTVGGKPPTYDPLDVQTGDGYDPPLTQAEKNTLRSA